MATRPRHDSGSVTRNKSQRRTSAVHSSQQYHAFNSIPGVSGSVMRERARQVSIENQHLALKLIAVQGHEMLQKKNLDKHFNEQVKIKNIICKLPVIDMSKNVFSHPEQQRSLSSKRYNTFRPIHRNSSGNLSNRSGVMSKSKRRLNRSISKASESSRHDRRNAPRKVKLKAVTNVMDISLNPHDP